MDFTSDIANNNITANLQAVSSQSQVYGKFAPNSSFVPVSIGNYCYKILESTPYFRQQDFHAVYNVIYHGFMSHTYSIVPEISLDSHSKSVATLATYSTSSRKALSHGNIYQYFETNSMFQEPLSTDIEATSPIELDMAPKFHRLDTPLDIRVSFRDSLDSKTSQFVCKSGHFIWKQCYDCPVTYRNIDLSSKDYDPTLWLFKLPADKNTTDMDPIPIARTRTPIIKDKTMKMTQWSIEVDTSKLDPIIVIMTFIGLKASWPLAISFSSAFGRQPRNPKPIKNIQYSTAQAIEDDLDDKLRTGNDTPHSGTEDNLNKANKKHQVKVFNVEYLKSTLIPDSQFEDWNLEATAAMDQLEAKAQKIGNQPDYKLEKKIKDQIIRRKNVLKYTRKIFSPLTSDP